VSRVDLADRRTEDLLLCGEIRVRREPKLHRREHRVRTFVAAGIYAVWQTNA
jgi:hypothetical protein